MGTTRLKDDKTRDLFEVPTPPTTRPGSLDHRSQISGMVGDLIKEAADDRYALAAEMSRLTDKDVTKYMLDAYSAESRDEYNLPFWLVPAFETASHTTALSAWLAEARGGRLLVGRDVLAAELGKLERVRDDANRKARALRKLMGERE